MKLKRHLPHISRFEGRIILSIMVCAAVPVFISLLFIPSIIESKLAMSMHAAVEKQLEDSALFYREFFQAKKGEFSATANMVASSPKLLEALKQGRDLKPTLEAFVRGHEDLVEVQVTTPSRTWLTSPSDQMTDPSRFIARTFSVEIGPTTTLKATFLVSTHYLRDRDRAAEIALTYQAARQLESTRARSFYIAYFGILVISVSIAMSVGLILSRSVTRRVMRIASATEEVAKGNMSVQVPVVGDDEIARLTNGFNRMVAEVEEARDRIIYLEKVSGWQDFARHLAHEIKNPLTPIRLAIHELRRRASRQSPEELQKLVKDVSEVVDDEVESLTRLVDEFSQFARLPAVTPTRVLMARFLRSFHRGYGHYRENVSLDMVLPSFDFEAPVDKVLMRRVLVNLVDNAAESGSEGIQVRLSAAHNKSTGLTSLRIEDNGPGISEAFKKRIFEPYFTTKSTGTGLGLAIVKKIVLQHRGSIDLDSSSLGGACFVIRLPKVWDELEPEPPDAGQETSSMQSDERNPTQGAEDSGP